MPKTQFLADFGLDLTAATVLPKDMEYALSVIIRKGADITEAAKAWRQEHGGSTTPSGAAA